MASVYQVKFTLSTWLVKLLNCWLKSNRLTWIVNLATIRRVLREKLYPMGTAPSSSGTFPVGLPVSDVYVCVSLADKEHITGLPTRMQVRNCGHVFLGGG